MSIGLRVVRGPDWSHGDKDGGEGHVGSVIAVNPDNTCNVVWDNGREIKCNIGKDGKCDLRIVDNAPTGVKHFGVVCDICNQNNVLGIRWKCCQCNDFDLCSICYFSDKHDLSHQFLRINRHTSNPTKVPKRSVSQKMRLFGIFPGAVVIRGKDWSYGTQDGGPGSEGKVMDVRNYGGDTGARNAAKVKWKNGEVNVYKIGACGKVDLTFIEPGIGFDYYRDHLPIPDASAKLTREMTFFEGNESSVEEEEISSVDTIIRIGDRVCVFLPADHLKQLQRGRGGWSMRMTECIGRIGKVKSIESDEIIEVEYDGATWQFYQGALRKVYAIKAGDTVKVLSEAEIVERLQRGHGGWEDSMEKACGKVGKVEKVDSDGDVVVQFGQQVWVYSPACLIPAPDQKVDQLASKGVPDLSASMRRRAQSSGNAQEELADSLAQMLANLVVLGQHQRMTIGPAQMIQACAKGDLSSVQQIVKMKKDLVSCSFKDLTPLMVACHEGHMVIVEFLLASGADVNASNEENITAVLLAAAGKKENVAIRLIEKGAKVSSTDKNGRTLVHHSSYHGMVTLLKAALQKGCDPNLQDVEGDTALHDGIAKGLDKVVNILLSHPNINLKLGNKRHFHPLMWAAFKEHAFAVERILEKDRGLMKILMPDNKSALHIAAINDHREVASLLILKGKANVNWKDNQGVSALHLACKEAYYEMAKLLLQNGADANIQENDGNGPLHYVVGTSATRTQMTGLLGLLMLGAQQPNDDNERFKIACLLIENKGDYQLKNKNNSTPLAVCKSQRVRNALENFIQKRQQQQRQTTRGATGDPLLDFLTALMVVPCAACKEEVANAKFMPCGHKIVCETCSIRFQSCPQCRTPVQTRIDNQGRRIVLEDPCQVQ